LIDFLIKFDAFPKIFLSLLITLLLILNTIQFNFLNCLGNDSLIITNGLYPQQLIFTIQFLCQLLSDKISSLSCSIRPIKDCHLITLVINVSYQIIQTHLCTHLSYLKTLFVFEIKEITLCLYPTVYLISTLPIMYFLL
jgi:hypothetical protein